MKCKDCLHFDACEGSNGTFDDEYVKDTAFSEDVRDLCPTFKNKDDYVEVVRCKDCKKFIKKGEEFLNNDVFGICEKSRTGFFDDGEEVYGNDFCSYGERRNDE